ncbi:glycosyltransferase [bacterium]|nr:glycosyltransferase [bacterium]
MAPGGGKTNMKTVCFFGIYDPGYARSKVLMRGFRENGFRIVECRADPKEHPGLKKYLKLFREYRKTRREKFNVILVAFPGQTVVWLAKLLFRQPIIFDAFLSLYNSNTEDRKVYGKMSIRGVKDWFLDWHSSRLASRVLLDTEEHIRYFAETFGIGKEKCVRVFIGCDEDIFFPGRAGEKNAIFTVEFHGSFIPLQGIDVIIRAAKLLENEQDMIFQIIGSGDKLGMRALADDLSVSNILFLGKKAPHEIPFFVQRADIVLGIFGITAKTPLVIPNKVYEGIACGRAVITANTPAAREFFIDTKNIVFCEAGNPEDLARKILMLKDNDTMRESIGREARKLFLDRLMAKMLVEDIVSRL